jgi:hypothetical protein
MFPRDVAARNFLLSKSDGKLNVKICDLGMASLLSKESTDSQVYEKIPNGTLLPIRWFEK